jgi:hypothetical protein
MTSGEPSALPDRIEGEDHTHPPADVQTSHGKTQVVHTALWAAAVAVLSNVANILKQLKDVIESAGQLERFVLDHRWLLVVILGTAVIWGNILLFRFLYRRLRRRIPAAYKVVAYVGSVGIVALVLVTNLFSLRSLLQGPIQVQHELLSELATRQDIDEGGYRSAPEEGLDAWTTAQSLTAVLAAGRYNRQHVKQGFSFLEGKRRDEGFEIISPEAKPFIRTEIAAWVTVAYVASLSSPNVWTDSERASAVDRTADTLRMITTQQDRLSGGWGPIPQSAAKHARSYATMMAVWALTEALLSKEIPNETKEHIAPAFEAGVSWLIRHYHSNLGWEEDPSYSLGKRFPGLTYQILFVLERAQLVPEHNSFKDTAAYRSIKRELRITIQSAPVGEMVSVPTSYIMVGDYACWGDFASYPWLLSALPILIADTDITSDERGYLKGVLHDELSKVPDLPSDLLKSETWLLAEYIINLSNFINSHQ